MGGRKGEGVQQKRWEFRILSESELIDVEEPRDLNAKMEFKTR
jgi:hypothetical protein